MFLVTDIKALWDRFCDLWLCPSLPIDLAEITDSKSLVYFASSSSKCFL